MSSSFEQSAPSRAGKQLYTLFESDDLYKHGCYLAKLIRGVRPDIIHEMREHPLGDDWLDYSRLSLAEAWQKLSGELYVARNPVTPDFIKVGMTAESAEARVRKLATSGVVGSYTCVHSWRVHDRFFTEKMAHIALTRLGIHKHKEHFHADWKQVCPVIDEVVASDIARFKKLGFDMTFYEKTK